MPSLKGSQLTLNDLSGIFSSKSNTIHRLSHRIWFQRKLAYMRYVLGRRCAVNCNAEIMKSTHWRGKHL